MTKESTSAVEKDPQEQLKTDVHASVNDEQPIVDNENILEQTDIDKNTVIDTLKKQLEESQQQSKDSQDKALRTQAEMENIKRRTQKDIEKAHKYGLEKIINDLLPVRDSLEMGINAASENSDGQHLEKLLEGAEMTLTMMTTALSKHGVSIIDPKDEKFNPEFHQAMSMLETDEIEPNTVTSVIQKGYKLNERLVRPAMVMVSKAPA
jgi:molecular chaperone GrpE